MNELERKVIEPALELKELVHNLKQFTRDNWIVFRDILKFFADAAENRTPIEHMEAMEKFELLMGAQVNLLTLKEDLVALLDRVDIDAIDHLNGGAEVVTDIMKEMGLVESVTQNAYKE